MIVLITGGASGLGKDIAEFLLDQHKVYIFDILPGEAVDKDYLNRLSGYYQVDLSNITSLTEVFNTFLSEVDSQIDILINNACPRKFDYFQKFKVEEIVNMIDAGLSASLLLTNLCLQIMDKKGFGRIINISSASALEGYSKGSIYCSIKMALIVFHESISKELSQLGKNITITTICPDSFQALNGENLDKNSIITREIRGVVAQSIKYRKSKLYYAISPGTRMRLSLQLLKKIKTVWT